MVVGTTSWVAICACSGNRVPSMASRSIARFMASRMRLSSSGASRVSMRRDVVSEFGYAKSVSLFVASCRAIDGTISASPASTIAAATALSERNRYCASSTTGCSPQ